MSGQSSVRWTASPEAVAAMLSGARSGLDAAAAELLSKSQEVVPVDTGGLRDSGYISTGESSSTISAAVSYGDPEAVVQHEHMEYNHPSGGQSKYLEQPLIAGADELVQKIADGIHAEIGGAR